MVEMTPAKPVLCWFINTQIHNSHMSQRIHLPVKLSIGKSSSRVNEKMGRVPIWKFLDLTHEIYCGRQEKRKIVGRRDKKERGCTQMGQETNL
jgi:hypothetical protein